MASFITTINCPISPPNLLSSPHNTTRFQINTKTRSKAAIPSTLSSLSSSTSSSSFFPSTHGFSWNEKKRGLEVVTRAAPSSTTLILAFIMPITLIVATVLTSIRIADKLDEKYLEELAVNQALMLGEDEDEDEDEESSTMVDEKSGTPTWAQEKPAVPRIRNRPKREAEV